MWQGRCSIRIMAEAFFWAILLLSGVSSAADEVRARANSSSVDVQCFLTPGLGQITSVVWRRVREGQEDIVWSDSNETEVTVDDPERYESDMDDLFLFLRISDVIMEHTALYTCEVKALLTSDNRTQTIATHQSELVVYDVPSPPLDLAVVSVNAYDVTVSWLPSADDQNSPITSYRMIAQSLEDSNDIDFAQTEDPSASNITIYDLSPYTNYTVFGVALNEAGASANSAPVPVFTQQAPPSQKPRCDNITADSSSLMLVFHTPPPESHNGPLLGYIFTALEEPVRVLVHNTTIADPRITSYVIGNLSAATRYMVNIQVFNMAGSSPPYEQIVRTGEGLPSEPHIVGSSSKSWDTLRVVWQRPQHTNGQLLGYYIYWENNGLVSKVAFTKDPNEMMHTHTISDLEPCTTYRVYITAFTSKGEGGHHSPQMVSTEAKGASAPNITRLDKGNSSHSAEVHWLRPASQSHLCHIKRYVLYFNASDPSHSRHFLVDATPFLVQRHFVSNLTGTNYSVSVVAETQGIHSSVYVRGELSEPRLIQLGSWTDRGLGGTSLTAGIIAGVVITAVVLILIVVIILFVRSWKKYVNNRHAYVHGPETVHLTAHTFPEYANNHHKSNSKNPEQPERTAIPVSQWPAHVARLHADDDFAFSEEYQDVDCGPGDHFSANASIDPDNKSKNRYINILAYDHSRVCLRSVPGKSGSDYINANYVDGYHKPKAYVATQGPLPNTFGDFWRLVWEQNSSVIVMITNLTERGKRKCDQYWPKDEEQQVTYDHIQVKLLNTYKMAHYTVRVFSLRNLKLKKKLGSERVILQYHYTDWPDHGVPDYTLPTLTFIRKSVAAHNEGQGSGPIIIHCSAGVGRTGTFIVIDSMIRQMQDVKTINVFGFLSHIRNQRNQLVQTEDQYIFIHDALLEYILSGNTEVKDSAFPRYVEDLLMEKEGEEESVLESQYKLVTQFRPKDYHTAAALLQVNMPKNRPNSLLPVDLARVRLPTRPGIEGSDYVNASYLQGYNKNEEFIITQHPMESTLEDFWRMVWEHNSMTMVFLNPDEEQNEEFPVFWPTPGNDMNFGHFTVSFIEENSDLQLSTKDFILQSTQDDYECTTRIFSTSSWPESCEPLSHAFDLIQTVQKWHNQHEVEMEGPIIVIDKYGSTSAATFCLLTTCFDQRQHEGSIDIYCTAKLYHLKRPGLWPKQEDYFMLYRAVESLCSEGSVSSERDSGIGNCKDHYSATVPAVRHSILKTINRAVSRNSDMTL